MGTRGYGDCEVCTFPEVTIGNDRDSALLKPGMRVLLPCPACGAPPIEEMTWLESTLDETAKAFAQMVLDHDMPLFHWAPTSRRKQIIRFGLRPTMRPTTHSLPGWRAPYICLADTPRWAWGLSGGQRSAPAGDWDLWECQASNLTAPEIMGNPSVRNGIHEVRTQHRIFKRHLWLAATKTKA